MKQEKKNFQHESIIDADQLEKTLAAISRGVASGKLKFSDEDDEIIFEPKGLMQLKLSATQTQYQQRFSIKVSWRVNNDQLKNKNLKVAN